MYQPLLVTVSEIDLIVALLAECEYTVIVPRVLTLSPGELQLFTSSSVKVVT
jgi:hypothetical protein